MRGWESHAGERAGGCGRDELVRGNVASGGARQYAGDIARVSGHLAAFVDRDGPDGQRPFTSANDSALMAIEFTDGGHGTIQVSGVAHVGERGQDFQIGLDGEAGSLEVDFDFASSRLRGVRDGDHAWQELTVPEEYLATATTPTVGVRLLRPVHQPVGRGPVVH